MDSWGAIGALAIAAAVGATWLTGALARHAHARGLYDAISERSAHSQATPRIGGLAIVAVAMMGYGVAYAFGAPSGYIAALLGGGAIVGLVGLVDDLRGVRVTIRAAAHFGAAMWAVWWIGPFDLSFLPFWQPGVQSAGAIITVVGIVWFINFYNFMDGINGLAATEAVSVAGFGAVLLYFGGVAGAGLLPALLLAAGCLGFLPWNFPVAKTFMGDASSGFLGFSLAVMAVFASRVDAALGVAWIVLIGVFAVDSTVTLIRRSLRREAIYNAHSEHAYQRLARRLRSHVPVTLAALGINCLWLFPIAWCIELALFAPVAGAFIAFFPLVITCVCVGAGRPRGEAVDARIGQ